MDGANGIDRRAVLAGVGIGAGMAALARAGTVTPPAGPVGPTMKTLERVEPRAAVNDLAGSAAAVHVIDAPGSYVLAADVVATPGKSGVLIGSDGVQLDLNGFSMRGEDGVVSGPGISVGAAVTRGVAVCNGAVRGCGGAGIDLGSVDGARLCALEVSGNAGAGILAGDDASIGSCVVSANGGAGASVGSRGRVEDATFSGNGAGGLAAQGESRVARCVSSGNGAADVAVGDRCMVVECVCDGQGIVAGSDSMVARCVVHGGSGIGVASRCVVRENLVTEASVGVCVLPGNMRTHVVDNSIASCTVGVRAATACNLFARNDVAGGMPAYDLAPGNTSGLNYDAVTDPDVTKSDYNILSAANYS